MRVALGSVAPTVIRASDAEAFAGAALQETGVWDGPPSRSALPAGVIEEFGRRVAAAARPIDDGRGTAAYRRHACAVLARRALTWALSDLAAAGGGP